MQCPKCEGDFEPVAFEDVVVDRCRGCGGLWFDAWEKERLQKMKNARSIDVGDESIGRQLNDAPDVQCPKCRVRMLHMVDASQFHIKFESCPRCYGTFFDAGEFKDLTRFTLLERLSKTFDLLISVR